MSPGWAGPVWGEPSSATRAPVPLRTAATAADAGYRADGGFAGHFAVFGACVVGVGHRLAGRRCDDAFGWALVTPDLVVLTVADGVSGAVHGGDGADVAVSAVTHYVLGQPAPAATGDGGQTGGQTAWSPGGSQWGLVLSLGAVLAANEALFETAEEMGCERPDLATTLVVAAMTRRQDQCHVDIARIGDSAAFVLAGGQWEEISAAGAEGDEDALINPSVDAVLPGPAVAEVGDIRVSSLDMSTQEALVLVTDGLAGPLRDGPTTVAPALAEVLARAPAGQLSPLELATATDFSRRGCQDDRTILLGWPLGPLPPSAPLPH